MPRPFTRNRRTLRPHHVYNQGFKIGGPDAPSRTVFVDREDRRYFVELLSRHLGRRAQTDSRNRPYKHLRSKIFLMAYCVMGTHFHLIVWQREASGIAELMHHVTASYTRYFNTKYGNELPLFNGPVQAKPVGERGYFRWLVGYVHDNHESGVDYEFSSHRAWVDPDQCPGWLNPGPGLEYFGSADDYLEHMRKRAERSRLNAELGL